MPSVSLHLPFPEVKTDFQLNHEDKIFLMGSCFITHLANSLRQDKFQIMDNPSGTIFDPLSLARSLSFYRKLIPLKPEELLHYKDCYYSWDHHSSLADIELEKILAKITENQLQANQFILNSSYIILTLGTAFYYALNLTNNQLRPVANCHKYPANNFTRKLLDAECIAQILHTEIAQWLKLNSELRVILTVSPVRHGKNPQNGLIENSQSKAQLILATRILCEKYPELYYYFPAYEILLDCLRDHRFYDIDLIHPNYLATRIITDYFANIFFSPQTKQIQAQARSIAAAKNHKSLHPNSQAHLNFLKQQLLETKELSQLYPQIDWHIELEYFHNEIMKHPLNS